MGELVVVRHGQASMLSADYDRLSDLGVEQGRRLGAFWGAQGLSFERAFSGPARRHLGTARECGAALQVEDASLPELQVLGGLDEHDAFGLVAKAVPALGPSEDIDRLQQEVLAATSRHEKSRAFQRVFEAVMRHWLRGEIEDPSIESYSAFASRVDEAVEQMLGGVSSGGRRIVAFTSVGPLAVMLRRALGTTAMRSFETAWRIRNCSITTFVFGRGRFTLDGFNTLPHLPEPHTHTFR